MAGWLQRVVPGESDKFVVLAALNLVNCIAFAWLPGQTMRKFRGRNSGVCS